MEGNSSDEELGVIKKRKPYTITKQREKWTQEEHTRFLEALKLYGRAWQRIEEHIGTKTAVQIRSHAQKFFTKLEKEAVEKGIAPGQVHDIDIPPPRPKRKSSSPYPRKSSTGTLTSEEALSRKPEKSMPLLGENQIIDIKSDSSGEKLMATKKLSRKRISEYANCSEVVTAFKDAKSNSISSLNKISSSHSEFIEFLPTKETMAEKIAIDRSSAPLEDSKSYIEQKTEGHQRKFSQQQTNLGLEDEGKTSRLEGLTIQDSSKGNRTLANKSTMHVSNGGQSMQNDASDSQNPILLTNQVGDEANGSLVSTIPVQDASTISYFHHPHTASVPLTHLHNDQDVYSSFLNSSTLPSLIVSTLLQNPAVHAAANLAASFCPSTVLHSTPYIQEVHNAHMNPTPSLEAIAAATVAAAASWWATQGLLPCFPPLAGIAFAPPKRNDPDTGIAQLPVHVTADENFPKEMQQIEDQNKSEVIKPQHASSKSKSSSSSGSDDCYGRDENSKELKDTGSSKIKSLTAHRSSDLDKARNQKKVDRSSCGSNTGSSSEVEACTMEKKHEKVNDEGKKDYDNFSKCGFNNYRLRSSGSLNESLKVSSEGRLAFQALFDRGVLPQSFSPPPTEKAITLPKKEASESKVNHKKTICCSTNLNQQGDKSKEEMYIALEKRKVHQSGFRPYRRCSVAAESNAVAEGTGNKRIRLQGEASS